MKCVIEVPHQRRASVTLMSDADFKAECERLVAETDNYGYFKGTKEEFIRDYGEDEVPHEAMSFFLDGAKDVVETHDESFYEYHDAQATDCPTLAEFGESIWAHDLHSFGVISAKNQKEMIRKITERIKTITSDDHQWVTVSSQLEYAREELEENEREGAESYI